MIERRITQYIKNNDVRLKAKLYQIIKLFIDKYGEPHNEGRNRLVFKAKNIVFKIPKNLDGINDNYSWFKIKGTN